MENSEYIKILKDRGALINFDEKEHKYTKDDHNYISATTLIRQIFPDLAFEELLNNPEIRQKIDAKAIIGNNVHKAIENYFLTNTHPEELGRRENFYYKNFQVLINSPWYKGMKFLATEQIVFNDKYKIAGTVDTMFEDQEGKLVLCDFKTSSSERDSYWSQGYIYSWLVKEALGLDYLPDVYFIYLKLYGSNDLKVIRADFSNLKAFLEKFEEWKKEVDSKNKEDL